METTFTPAVVTVKDQFGNDAALVAGVDRYAQRVLLTAGQLGWLFAQGDWSEVAGTAQTSVCAVRGDDSDPYTFARHESGGYIAGLWVFGMTTTGVIPQDTERYAGYGTPEHRERVKRLADLRALQESEY